MLEVSTIGGKRVKLTPLCVKSSLSSSATSIGAGGRARAGTFVEVSVCMVARAAAGGVAARPLARVDDVTWDRVGIW